VIPFEKMRVPLPVCHPVVISVLIHNRYVDVAHAVLDLGITTAFIEHSLNGLSEA